MARPLSQSSRVVLLAAAAAVAVAGCAHKPKRSISGIQERPVELLYDTGADQLDHHHWLQAVDYFHEVEREHPYSEWARRAILMTAYAHYEANDYESALGDADRFVSLYPGNASAVYAYYLKAICYFEQITDVGRDQGSTEQALSALREVIRRFPDTQYAIDARLKLDMVNDQLAGKEMNVGRWYLRQGQTLAAINRFKTVIDRYQTTSHTPEALYRLAEAYMTLGLVEEAKKNAAVLGYNYPGDPWYTDAYALMNNKGLRPAVVPISHGHGVIHVPRLLPKGTAKPPPTT